MNNKYICSKCHLELSSDTLTDFRKRRKKIVCDRCKKRQKKEYDQARYLENSEAVKENVKTYAKNNKKLISERSRKYREIHYENRREYDKGYREKYKPIRNAREKERLLTEPLYALKKRMRNNLLSYMKSSGRKKPSHTQDVIGCTYEELKAHFESQFTDGMTWEIFCTTDLIHIDHILPVSSFDFSDDNEIKKCFHYTNLQPLWKIDNLKKYNKIL